MAEALKAINSFSARKLPGDLPQSELLYGDRPTGLIVQGVCLERQFQHEKGFVLFLTGGCPFEEILDIYFISPELKILDGLELGFIYTPGILLDLEVGEGAVIRFSFFGGDLWALKIMNKPRWALNLSFFYSFLFPIYCEKRRFGGPIVKPRLLLERLS